GDGAAARNRDFPQFGTAEEAYPVAVRREERVIRSVGTGQHHGRVTIESPNNECRRVATRSYIGEYVPIRRQSNRCLPYAKRAGARQCERGVRRKDHVPVPSRFRNTSLA